MKEMSDEELQHLAEQGGAKNENLSFVEKEELMAYQSLFKSLNAEPAEGLPFNFAANVRRAVQQQAAMKGDLKFQFILLFIFASIIAAAFGLLQFISPAATEQLTSISPTLKWSAGLAVLMFWCVNLLTTGIQGLNKFGKQQ